MAYERYPRGTMSQGNDRDRDEMQDYGRGDRANRYGGYAGGAGSYGAGPYGGGRGDEGRGGYGNRDYGNQRYAQREQSYTARGHFHLHHKINLSKDH